MKFPCFSLVIPLFFIAALLFFVMKPPHIVKIMGDSNGDFLGEGIYINKKIEEFEVGQFIVVQKKNEYFVHPIINVVEIDGETVGYITKGIKNKNTDGLIFPYEIVGRAFRILEDGSIEADTKYPE